MEKLIKKYEENLPQLFKKHNVDEIMKIEDRIKTTIGLGMTDERDFLEGKILSIDNQKCLDGSEFEKIMIKLDDGRILPCIREELELINS